MIIWKQNIYTSRNIFTFIKTHVFSIEFFYTDTHILKKTKYDQSLYEIDKIHNM